MSSSKRTDHKVCVVPQCPNTSKTTPDKLFISFPPSIEQRTKWQIAMGRTTVVPVRRGWYCCQDHFDVENDIENYMYIKLMKTGKIRLKPGVIPHIFDCQKSTGADNQQPCAGNSLNIKEEIDFDEESALDYENEEIGLDVPEFVSTDELRIKQESDVTDITNVKQETDTTILKIKEEVLDTNEEIHNPDTTGSVTFDYKIKEETLDIKDETEIPDSTTEDNILLNTEQKPVRKKYCDKAVQVDLNLVNVRTIGIQCCLDENDSESSSGKRKTTQVEQKPRSKRKRIKTSKK